MSFCSFVIQEFFFFRCFRFKRWALLCPRRRYQWIRPQFHRSSSSWYQLFAFHLAEPRWETGKTGNLFYYLLILILIMIFSCRTVWHFKFPTPRRWTILGWISAALASSRPWLRRLLLSFCALVGRMRKLMCGFISILRCIGRIRVSLSLCLDGRKFACVVVCNLLVLLLTGF